MDVKVLFVVGFILVCVSGKITLEPESDDVVAQFIGKTVRDINANDLSKAESLVLVHIEIKTKSDIFEKVVKEVSGLNHLKIHHKAQRTLITDIWKSTFTIIVSDVVVSS